MVENVEYSKTHSSPANWVTDRVDHGWTLLSPPPMPQAPPLPTMVRYAGFLEYSQSACVSYSFLVVKCSDIFCMFSGGGECASSSSVLMDCKDGQPSQLLQRWCDHSFGAAGELVAWRTQWGSGVVPQNLCYSAEHQWCTSRVNTHTMLWFNINIAMLKWLWPK